MEDILLALLEFLAEVLFQALLEGLWDVGVSFGERRASRREATPNRWAWGLGSVVLGSVLGLVSLWVLPHSFIRVAWLRIVYLFVAPALVAWLVYRLRMITKRGDPRIHAICAFWFTVGVVVVRFIFVVRAMP